MSRFQNSRRVWLAFASCALLCISLAACKQEEKQPAPQPASNVVSDTLTREIQPRDPDKDNGEKQRILKRDGLGRLREIQIDFKGGHRGWIYKNQQGKIESVKIVMADGQVREGKPGINRALGEGKMTGPDGKLIVQMKPTGQDGLRGVIYWEDGTTEQFYEVVEGDTRTDVRLDKDGKMLFETVYSKSGPKLSVKIFDAGKLIYEEKAIQPDATAGGVNEYEATIYDATGKATHRLKLREGPFNNGVGRVTEIAVLADDGTVAQTLIGDKLPTATLGPALENIEVLRTEMKAVFDITNQARRVLLVVEQDLSLLLQDKTK